MSNRDQESADSRTHNDNGRDHVGSAVLEFQ
jgi:hypothetical protein